MAENVGNMIAASCSLGMNYTKRLLQDVRADQFARFACPGGQTVRSNHPAFILGHLCSYGPRIVEQLGGDAAAVRPPEQFTCLFAKDSSCQDDPNGTIYPAMDVIVNHYFAGYQAAIDTLCRTDDSVLLQPNPIEGRMTELFSTMGAMHAFYVGGHLMMHLGQMSAWRRMMGLPPA